MFAHFEVYFAVMEKWGTKFFKLLFSFSSGDLEIVSNGTRRHTRDVGTIFPSPGEARALRQISFSSSSAERGRRGPGSQKQRKTKRSPSKRYPEGTSSYKRGVCWSDVQKCTEGIRSQTNVLIRLVWISAGVNFQVFHGSSLLMIWGQRRGRRTVQRRSRLGGRVRPGLSRTAECIRGENRSDRDKSTRTETNRLLLHIMLNLK